MKKMKTQNAVHAHTKHEKKKGEFNCSIRLASSETQMHSLALYLHFLPAQLRLELKSCYSSSCGTSGAVSVRHKPSKLQVKGAGAGK